MARVSLKNLIITFFFIILLIINIFFIIEDIKFISIISSIIIAIFVIFLWYKEMKKQKKLPIENLPDRISLLNKLKKSKNLKSKTLILINIDSFEDINDFFGYDFGDSVLLEVSKWLQNNLPDKNAKLYKLEADNYAIFTKIFKTKKELTSYLNRISSKIVDMNFNIQDNELDIGFTMGAAINNDNLLKLTHSAFKKSKTKQTQFEIYSEEQSSEDIQEKNIRINKIIKKSVQSHNIVPFFQPIYNIKLNKIDKYEALMRIQMDDGSLMMPSEFLKISKRSKLYPRLTKEIFSKVTNGIISSSSEISINLSVDDILDKNTSGFILKMLEKNDIGSWLVFEILESEGIENYKDVTRFLRNIKSLGAKLAIDDFGSGYSNFEYILKLDVDYLKIDGSLIKNIDVNEDTQIITSTIVEFAKKLKIKTIAEFVHNKQIYDKVKDLDFDYAQGYYIGKPDKNLMTGKNLDYLKDENLFTILT